MSQLRQDRSTGRRARGARGALFAAALASAATGCSGEISGVAGSTSAVTIGSSPFARGRTSFDAALLGRWRRAVLFRGADGTSHGSEITWSFAADGSALRSVVSRNVTLGLADVVSTAASWRTEGNTVVIVYLSPGSGAVRFTYFVDRTAYGDVLYLDDQAFTRVGP